MSIQIAILKILSSHRDGRAQVSSITQDIAVLTRSGREWSDRLNRLASRISALDIFGSGYVIRDDHGWTITQAGRDFLVGLEAITQDNLPPQPQPAPAFPAASPPRPNKTLVIIGGKNRTRRRRLRGQTRARSG